MYLWNSHPKVYLPIEVTGEATCPYCSSTYRLVEEPAGSRPAAAMIVVTGGAGFIGSNLVRELNRRGHDDVVVVDDLSDGRKFANLVDCRDRRLLRQVRVSSSGSRDGELGKIEAIFHQGACAVTTEWNGRYMMETNYRYSVELFEHCLAQAHAADLCVVGGGLRREHRFQGERQRGRAAAERLRLLEAAVRFVRAPTATPERGRAQAKRRAPVVGLRYFNVYGPGEAHKGSMASVAFHLHGASRGDGRGALVRRQRRLRGRRAAARFRARRRRRRREPLVATSSDRYPASSTSARARALRSTTWRTRSSRGTARASCATSRFRTSSKSRYQSFTEADITALRAAGYARPFRDVRAGIKDYLDALGARLVTAARQGARRRPFVGGRHGDGAGAVQAAATARPEAPRFTSSRRRGRCPCSRACPKWRAASSSPSVTASWRSGAGARWAVRCARERYAPRDRAAALGESCARAMVRESAAAHGIPRRVALRFAERRAIAGCAARPDGEAVRRVGAGARRSAARGVAAGAAAAARQRSAQSRAVARRAWAPAERAAGGADARRGIRCREALARGAVTVAWPRRSPVRTPTSSCSAPRRRRAIGDEVAAQARSPRVRNLCGATSLADVVDLLGAADVAVSNDSGLLHVAAAAGAPVVADLRLVVAEVHAAVDRCRSRRLARARMQPVLRARLPAQAHALSQRP